MRFPDVAPDPVDSLRMLVAGNGSLWAALNHAVGDALDIQVVLVVQVGIIVRRPDICTSFGIGSELLLWALWSTFKGYGVFK